MGSQGGAPPQGAGGSHGPQLGHLQTPSSAPLPGHPLAMATARVPSMTSMLPLAPRQAAICYDFVKGVCQRGAECKYSHDLSLIA